MDFPWGTALRVDFTQDGSTQPTYPVLSSTDTETDILLLTLRAKISLVHSDSHCMDYEDLQYTETQKQKGQDRYILELIIQQPSS